MKPIVKRAGFVDKEDDEYIAAQQIIKNQQRFIARALKTDNKKVEQMMTRVLLQNQ